MSPRSVIAYDRDLPEIAERDGRAHLPPESHLRKKPDSEEEFEIVEGRRPSDRLLVDSLRQAVGQWRYDGYPGASEVTLRLFNYWFEEDHTLSDGTLFRYYFGQREAAETLAYLVEIEGNRDIKPLIEAYGKVRHAEEGEDGSLPFEEGVSFETSSTTGTRRVRYRDPDSANEVAPDLPAEGLRRYAFKMATGSGKTMVMAMAAVYSYFHSLMVDGSPLSSNFLIVAPNVIVYQRLESDFADGKIFYDLPLIPPEWRSRWRVEVILRGESKEPSPSGNLFLTNIQQLYAGGEEEWTPATAVEALLGPPPKGDAPQRQRPMAERIKGLSDLVVINDEAHHVHDEDLAWHKTLTDIHHATGEGIALWLDFSATPKDQGGIYFPWIICDYPLAQAVEDGIVKAPLIVHRVEGSGPTSVTKDNAAEAYRDWILAALQRFYEHRQRYGELGKKAVLFIMAENTAQASAIGEWLVEDPQTSLTREEVLVIHTKGGGEIQKRDLDAARRAARDIDDPDNPVQVVVSVLMLREGWDVKSVTVVLGLRPFNATPNILPEQAVGRGLRPMVGIERTQTLEVIGTQKFEELVRELETEGVGVKTTSDPPALPVKVEPVAERQDYDIAVPEPTYMYGRSFAGLKRLDPAEIEPLYSPDDLEGGQGGVRLRMEFGTTETPVHEEEVVPDPPLVEEAVASITREVIRNLSLTESEFSPLFGVVKRYLRERCFSGEVDLSSVEIRSVLRPEAKGYEIASQLATRIGEATVWTKPSALTGKEIRLSRTPPFSWRRNLPPLSCEKTVFNYVATFNNFEGAFAQFLDKCLDVARFSSLGVTHDAGGTRFSVNYLKEGGAIGVYYPDWVVIQTTEEGEVGWIVETKGREWENTEAKDRAMELWCEHVSGQTDIEWRYTRVNQRDFEASGATTFTSLVDGEDGHEGPSLLEGLEDGEVGSSPAYEEETHYPGKSPYISEGEAASLLREHVPQEGGIELTELLETCAQRLGFEGPTRGVRRPLKKALSGEDRAGRLRTDWQRVWRPRRGRR